MSLFQTNVPIENGLLSESCLDSTSISNDDLLTLYNILENSSITDITTLDQAFEEVLIRFDASPSNYQKSDFRVLIKAIYDAFRTQFSKTIANTQINQIHFMGGALLSTNPISDAITFNHTYPGIYIATQDGMYPYFDTQVSGMYLKDSITFLMPEIVDNEFVQYSPFTYKPPYTDHEIAKNKKSTLRENSETYYPNQRAVNTALLSKADLIGGVIPSSQLPSYIDDIIEYPTKNDFPTTGEEDKIYIALDSHLSYRWSGSNYVSISSITFTSSYISPLSPSNGDEWLDLSSGIKYTWVIDEDGGQWVQLGQSNSNNPYIGDQLVTPITYSELVTLIAGSNLIPNSSYLITDYQTIHTIPNTTDKNTSTVEPLLVMAATSRSLYSEAKSSQEPYDIIYYNVNNDGRILGSTKGYIYRRVDTLKHNDFPFDYKHVKFRRWQINAPTWVSNYEYSYGQVVKGTEDNYVYVSIVDSNIGHEPLSETNMFYWIKLNTWENLSYVSPTPSQWRFSENENENLNMLTIPCTSLYTDYLFCSDLNTMYNNSWRCNTLLWRFNSIVGSNFQNNVIIGNFYNNTISNNFIHNTVKASFSNSWISNEFQYNTIEKSFYNNYIGESFNNNKINSNYHLNIIDTHCEYNNFFNDVKGNIICNYFKYNIVENKLERVMFAELCTYVNIKSGIFDKDLREYTELYAQNYPHEIIKTSGSSIIITWYNNSGVLQSILIS